MGGEAAWHNIQKRCIFIDYADSKWSRATLDELRALLLGVLT